MAVVCQACGAENRGGVSACRICAASLLPVPERPPRGQRKHSSARAASPPSTKNTRWWLAFGVLAIALVLIGARMATSSQAETQAETQATAVATTEAPEPAAALALQADGAGSSAGDSLAEATAAAEARLQASLERLAREDRQHQEAQARAARERERRQAEQARQRETSTGTKAQAQAPRRIEPAIPAVAKAPDTPAMPARPSTATEAPGPAASVTKQCADSSNFFSRSICERRVCEDAALAQDPVCRRLRELDQASRPDPYLLN